MKYKLIPPTATDLQQEAKTQAVQRKLDQWRAEQKRKQPLKDGANLKSKSSAHNSGQLSLLK